MKKLLAKFCKVIVLSFMILVLPAIQSCERPSTTDIQAFSMGKWIGLAKGFHRNIEWQRRMDY
jgi:hypothetical protein